MAALAGAAAAAVSAAVWLRAQRAEAVAVYWTLPDFQLVDQHGKAVGRDDLAGSPWIADFIFTRCGGICPAMTARMARLQPALPAGVRLVSITVDPEHDTPAVLSRYAHDFEAGPSWVFLTGPRPDLYRLSIDGFKLEAMAVPPEQQQAGGDGPFLHSSKFVLVDGRGRVRGYYDSADDAAMARLAADVLRVAKETP